MKQEKKIGRKKRKKLNNNRKKDDRVTLSLGVFLFQMWRSLAISLKIISVWKSRAIYRPIEISMCAHKSMYAFAYSRLKHTIDRVLAYTFVHIPSFWVRESENVCGFFRSQSYIYIYVYLCDCRLVYSIWSPNFKLKFSHLSQLCIRTK